MGFHMLEPPKHWRRLQFVVYDCGEHHHATEEEADRCERWRWELWTNARNAQMCSGDAWVWANRHDAKALVAALQDIAGDGLPSSR